ncbi:MULTISPECIES: hypothetical protein [Delftia]|nr:MULTISPECIES: hypothetical protein [Delftia]WEM00999.1 hypothetical protein PW274_12175 [Delftia tsuruhatensis]
MTHILIPREPSTALLRPFIGCNSQELHEAWAAMVRIAEVQHARAGSQCLQQIEEGPQSVDIAINHGTEDLAMHPLSTAPAALAGPAWDKTRDSLAALLLELARRPFLDFDVACIALDAATEPGMPLAYMRHAPAAPALEAPAAPADGATPGPWFVRKREVNGELRDCFVAAPDCQGLAYDACILCDDEYHDGMGRKLADCELIVAAVNQHRAALAAAPQAPAAPADPMDWPLPCDVTVGHGTIRKGCKLRTLMLRMQVLYDLSQKAELAAPAAPAEAQRLAKFLQRMRTHLGSCRESAGTYNQQAWDDYERAWTMLLGMAAPAAPSAIATQVIENLLQLARIVNTAVEDWGETKEDDSLEVIFQKEEADKMESILEFFDSLPDAPEGEGVILSGPSRAARVLRAMAPAAPAVDAETSEDAERFRAMANAALTDDEVFGRALDQHPDMGGDATIDDVRAMFDAARAAQAKEGGAQ